MSSLLSSTARIPASHLGLHCSGWWKPAGELPGSSEGLEGRVKKGCLSPLSLSAASPVFKAGVKIWGQMSLAHRIVRPSPYISALVNSTAFGNKYLYSTRFVLEGLLLAWNKPVQARDWIPQKQTLRRRFKCKGFTWELISGNAERRVREARWGREGSQPRVC